MINILFFAQIRELIGEASLTLEANFDSVDALREHLTSKGDRWALALGQGNVLMAVNQSLVPATHPISAGDEIAFFPPVTGG